MKEPRPEIPAGFSLARGAERGQPEAMHWLTKFVTIPAFGLAAVALAIGMSFEAPEAESEAEQDPTAGARYACQHFIQSSLNDPGSVEWIDRLDWATNERADGIITVRAEYRAANAFGGMVREVTYCDIAREDGEFRLVQFRQ